MKKYSENSEEAAMEFGGDLQSLQRSVSDLFRYNACYIFDPVFWGSVFKECESRCEKLKQVAAEKNYTSLPFYKKNIIYIEDRLERIRPLLEESPFKK
jgi:hypothetical protein